MATTSNLQSAATYVLDHLDTPHTMERTSEYLLPLELVHHVADHLRRRRPRCLPPDMRLVCREWSLIARRRLFSHVIVSSAHSLKSERISECLAFVEENPWVCALVETLRFLGDYEPHDLHEIMALVARFPRLCKLFMRDMHILRSSPDSLSNLCVPSKLDVLSIEDCVVTNVQALTTFFDLIKMFSDVDELVFKNVLPLEGSSTPPSATRANDASCKTRIRRRMAYWPR